MSFLRGQCHGNWRYVQDWTLLWNLGKLRDANKDACLAMGDCPGQGEMERSSRGLMRYVMSHLAQREIYWSKYLNSLRTSNWIGHFLSFKFESLFIFSSQRTTVNTFSAVQYSVVPSFRTVPVSEQKQVNSIIFVGRLSFRSPKNYE